MYSKIALILLAVGMCYAGTYIFELRQELSDTKKEFVKYQEDTNKKFKDLEMLQNDMNLIKKKFHKAQQKAVNDAIRESVVVKKPKLVEKQFERSFNRLMVDMQEATK